MSERSVTTVELAAGGTVTIETLLGAGPSEVWLEVLRLVGPGRMQDADACRAALVREHGADDGLRMWGQYANEFNAGKSRQLNRGRRSDGERARGAQRSVARGPVSFEIPL